jgi:glycosyltransferase involved in cell wall biosynthesis
MLSKGPRLLSLNNYHYRRGGSDVVFLEHNAMFHTLGWQTAVMAMHHPKNEPSCWSSFFVDEIEFGQEYGTFEKISMAGKVIYSIEAKRKLSLLLDEFPADVAHVHCIYHHLSPSVLLELKQRGIPTVMTAHDLKLACPAYKMLNSGGICEKCHNGNLINVVTNRCIQHSLSISALVMIESALHKSLGLYKNNLDRVVVPSLFYKKKLMEWGWAENKLTYIPNYVDASTFTPQYNPGDYFFYFGRLSIEKGVGTLIKAAALAKVKLRVAGTGPEDIFLKSLAAEVGCDIEFLGYVSGEALWKWVREARAVVLPSEWYENSPMSVLEAYACGKPIIGARIGGIPEMVHEGETGALFKSCSVDELADSLCRFAAMPDCVVSEMGETACNYVSKTFTTKRYRDDILDLYEQLGVNIRRNGSSRDWH